MPRRRRNVTRKSLEGCVRVTMVVVEVSLVALEGLVECTGLISLSLQTIVTTQND